jgi:predicted Rossmann fold nucleotide-binding protein DprA/Smf involved in DNA uptake
LITADFALSQDRDVAVVPGSLYGNSSLGCHFLANQGAFLLVATDHVAKQLALRGIVDQEERKKITHDQGSSFCQEIMSQLMIGRKSIDQLTSVFEIKGWKEDVLWQALFELEAAGEIVRIGPGLYSR